MNDIYEENVPEEAGSEASDFERDEQSEKCKSCGSHAIRIVNGIGEDKSWHCVAECMDCGAMESN